MVKIIKSCLVIEKKPTGIFGARHALAAADEYEEKGSLTQDSADALYAETKMMIEGLIIQAQSKSDAIILKAKEEAQCALEQAEQESKAINEEAYNKGYAQGLQEGLIKTENDLKSRYDTMASLINDLRHQKEQYLLTREKEIIELVMALTEKILGTIINIRPEVISHIVKNTLVQVNGALRITVKVNPIHIPYLSEYLEIFSDTGCENIQVLEDCNINTGDCRVITENGFVDSLLDAQLGELKQALLEVVEHV